MENNQEEEKELKEVLSDLGKAKGCRVCKISLVFGFVGLLLASVIVYLDVVQNNTPKNEQESFHSIPPTPEDVASIELEYNQRILELGQTAFGERSESEFPKNTIDVSGSVQSGTNTPESSREIPEGPPMVVGQ